MSAHTAPAAKAALLAMWQADATLTAAGVTITWGGPTEEDDVAEEHIFLGDVLLEEDWLYIGRQRREEKYELGFQVRVKKYGDDEQTTETRAWAILDLALAAMRTTPQLSGTIFQWGAVKARQTNMPSPQQWTTAIAGSIACTARI